MQCKQFSEFRHDYWSGCLFLSLASYWLFNHFKLAQMVCFVRPFLNLLFVKDCRRIFISHNGIHQQRLLLELYLTSPIKWLDKHCAALSSTKTASHKNLLPTAGKNPRFLSPTSVLCKAFISEICIKSG